MDRESVDKQVVSRQRVIDHGEVLTGTREVNAMLDLVKPETERIDSRFLEPACGTGNFLVAILERKLGVVARKYRRSQLEYERNAVLAVSSIYGIDILEGNVRDCRLRLFDLFNSAYTALYKGRAKDACRAAVQTILARNILCGDALTLHTMEDWPRPIVFSEWSFPFNDSRIQRRDYVFAEMIPPDPAPGGGLLDRHQLVSDTGKPVFIPKEMRVEPPVHFLTLGETDADLLQS